MKIGSFKESSLPCWSVSDLSNFYVAHKVELVRYADRLLRNSHKAEEIVQDALIRVILASPVISNDGHALAYIKKAIENLCLDFFRIEGRQPSLVLIDDVIAENEVSLQSQADHSEVVAAADDAAIVRQALSLLSPAERTALVMWEMEGRSAKEISLELGIKESSVRHTVSRARASLRRILTELVVDEQRGLTALDFLSTTYKKSAELAKKSSRVALSFILLVFAYLGFVNVVDSSHHLPTTSSQTNSTEAKSNGQEKTSSVSKAVGNTKVVTKNINKVGLISENAKASQLSFAGLDKNGIPTGFTVTDNTDSLGSLDFVGRDTAMNDSGLILSSIAKTAKGSANILLNQTLSQDSSGMTYDALISFGRKGGWIPTFTKVISVESERLVSGNYMVTAVVQVKSEVETTIVIPASADGRDLEVPPSRVVTRILLNPSKTQVLAQAVQVVEKVSK